MKQLLLTLFLLSLLPASVFAAPEGRLLTPWGENVDPENPWPEYPRPIMERSRWANLNGKWDYAIRPKGDATPAKYDGHIVVPYPVESYLSQVGKTVGENNELWYHRTFKVPASWKGERVLLNFGAVDWKCDVWVNDMYAGGHEGGFSPFSLALTDALAKSGENDVTVRVFDPTDKGYQPRGKQVTTPKTIWYTPVTGIWQTVWLEPVPSDYISNVKIVPDVDANSLKVAAITDAKGCAVAVTVTADGKPVASGVGVGGNEVEIEMPADVKLWSPDSPYLYGVEISLLKNGKNVDKVNSYAAMRKVSTKRGKGGVMRFQLNNKDIFHFGPLDQGWWPDGLYTAPSYEAMVYDIDKTKDLGFNMIRKHIKVEPALWYAYCDKAGILVWQDMPSGDKNGSRWNRTDYFKGVETPRSPESDRQYRKEWKEIIDNLVNYPSIAVWVPFNEAWGQYNTVGTAEWTKLYDPTRLVNPASGGNHFDCGDILDVHNYPEPQLILMDYDRANVLGEYGGIGYAVDGHLWAPDRNWGYVQFKSPEEVTEEYLRYLDILSDLSRHVYTGAVYTQTTDVEIEVNGLMTYDRKVIKVDEKKVAEANRNLIRQFSE